MSYSMSTVRSAILAVALMLTLCVSAADTPENRLITLRNNMERSDSPLLRSHVLAQVADVDNFQAMLYAAAYLSDKAVARTAAHTVAAIAARHPEYNSQAMRDALTRALPLLKGKDKKQAKALLRSLPTDVEGFVSIFNGRDLTGWKGLVQNPIARRKMTSEQLASAQVKADEQMRKDWKVEDGLLAYVGTGFDNICTVEQYADFEMIVDWKLDPSGTEPDAGIYLRGTPQVQIWDIARLNVGAQVGSGGLYNNTHHRSTPLCVADNRLGEWNTFLIRMVGDRVSVWLNGTQVVDNVVMENYWDRSQPIFDCDQIELQAHGSKVYYRDIYVRRLGK